MWTYVLEGILFGLTLTVLLGPIFIALTQTAIEKGGRAGMMVGLGVWCSDTLIISMTYLFIQIISKTVHSEDFKFYLGTLGGVVLMAFGVGAFFKKISLSEERQKYSKRHYAGFWLKGFIVNTFNPFTFVFWIGVISTYVIGREISSRYAWVFLISIMITIILTDSMKVGLAKMIRHKLQENHMVWFSRVAGVALFIFGVYLLTKSL